MALFAPAARLIEEDDPWNFLSLVNGVLHGGAAFFRDMQQDLATAVNSVPDTASSRKFLLECLGLLLDPSSRQKKEVLLHSVETAPNLKNPALTSPDALTFLLLDAVPAAHQHPCQPPPSTHTKSASINHTAPPVRDELPQPDGESTSEANITTAALRLVLTCVEAGNLKPAIRVAQAYGLTSSDLMAHPDIHHQMHQLFMEHFRAGKGGLTSLAGMVMQFDVLGREIDIALLITDLVKSQKEDFAEKWVLERKLGLKEQVAYVDTCLATGKFKAALRVIRTCKLTEVYPEVELEHCRREFAKLMEKGNWQTAARFVGTDRVMQEQLVVAMAADEPERAQAYAEEWGLSAIVPALDPEARAAAEAARAAQFHGLSLPIESVLLVNDLATVKEAHTVLAAATVVGLDAEWRPRARRAALLQVATVDRVLLFDFPALLYPNQPPSEASSHSSSQQQLDGLVDAGATPAAPVQITADPELVAATDDCLVAVFQNPACLKVGLEVGGDLKKLAGSCPGLRVWSQPVGPVLEIRDLWVEHLAAITDPESPAFKQQQSAGLSTLCTALHGRPLDKTMQMSDWGRRPLSGRQMLYAAQDAHVLVTMYERLRQLVPHADQVVAKRRFMYQAHH